MSDKRDEDRDQDPGFRVVDRRRAAREEHEEPTRTPPPETRSARQEQRSPPPVDFSTFVLSLASTAMVQLGVAPHPETGETVREPLLARETIDILGMLREKTKGNLTDEETRFFDALLYDLRMKYVEVTRS